MADLICIVCPRGCHLHVENGEVKGNFCKRGISYGLQEATNPMRMVTSTVDIKNAKISRLPVGSTKPIPKAKIFAVIEELRKVSLEAPVLSGKIIIKNVLNTNADIIATRTIEREENQ